MSSSRSAKLVQSRPVPRLFSSFPSVRNDTWNARRGRVGSGGERVKGGDMRIMGIEVDFEGGIG